MLAAQAVQDRPVDRSGNRETPLLVAEGLVKRWPRVAIPVLAGVRLHVPWGQAVHIAGRNGAGKTTLLRILGGLIRADAGRISVDGLDPRRDQTRFQHAVRFASASGSGLYARLTVRQQVDFAARMLLLNRDRRAAVVTDAVREFALEDLAEARSDRLSMGQRQRLRLSLGFMAGPRLVLLDEPCNSLDDVGLVMLRSAVTTVLDRGGAVVWVSPGRDRDEYSFHQRLELASGQLTS